MSLAKLGIALPVPELNQLEVDDQQDICGTCPSFFPFQRLERRPTHIRWTATQPGFSMQSACQPCGAYQVGDRINTSILVMQADMSSLFESHSRQKKSCAGIAVEIATHF
jgi:hypothetical protein